MDNEELIITDTESKRISILKVWLSIMVVFIHSYGSHINLPGETVNLNIPKWLDSTKIIISQIISRSAVPCFFFLAAYFLYRKRYSWKKNILKKINSLLVPYFVINILWIIFYYICQQFTPLSGFFVNNISEWNLYKWFGAFWGTPDYPYPLVYPLWFLRDLFLLNLLSFVFEFLVKKLNRISLIIFVLLWLLLDSSHIYFFNLQAICFWGLGCYMSQKRLSISNIDRMNKVVFIYPFLIILSFLLYDKSGIIPRLVFRSCVMIGCLFLFIYTTRIKKGKLQDYLLYLSKFSFCIYLFHEMNLTITRKLLTKILPQSVPTSVFLYFGTAIIIVVLCVLLSIFLERFVPKFYKVICGGRSK